LNKDSIIEEARDWLSAEQEGIDIYKKQGFLSWINISEEHERIFEEERSFRESIIGLPNQYKQKIAYQTRKELKREKLTKNIKFITPIAASFLIVICIYLFTDEKVLYSQEVYGKKVIQDIIMPDSSKIVLDVNTNIKVCYTDKKRKILLKEGKAFFEVTSNKNRPFYVKSDSILIQVLGTKFEVLKEKQKVKVSVKEGIVAIRHGEDEDSKLIARIEKGDVLEISYLGKIESLKNISIEKLSSWKDRKFIFNQTPLDKVIKDFLKYSDKAVDIKLDSKNYPVTGEFNVYELEKFLQFLPLIYPIEIEKKNDSIKILKKGS
jgi:transmembrane sensor